MSGNVLMKIPKCPIHGDQLVLRDRNSKETDFCGTWYVCPQCGYTVLFPSKELTAQLDDMRRKATK